MLLVRRPGLQTTVQDLGRPGYGRYGVPLSGAMDARSLRLGNKLLDNREDAAALELTLVGPELEALADGIFAYTGTDMHLTIQGRPVPPGRTFGVHEGDVLRFGAAVQGARSYLCVPGGVDVPVVLGSRATAVTARLGGLDGRPLLGGDTLSALSGVPSLHQLRGRRLRSEFLEEYTRDAVLRVVEGPQADAMREALEGLIATSWQVSSSLNRLGVRLQGPALRAYLPNFTTEGVPLGAVQMPPDGAPILLLADRQTTGGYPKPAVVASVDLRVAGQLRPGDSVRFELISQEHAVELLREQEARMQEQVWEKGAEPRLGSLAELVQILEASRIREIRIKTPQGSFRWKRG